MTRTVTLAAALLVSACASTPDGEVAACRSSAAKAQLGTSGEMSFSYAAVPVWGQVDPSSQVNRGIAPDLARALAYVAGLTLRIQPAANLNALGDMGRAGEWNVGFSVVIDEWSSAFDYSDPVIIDEATFLVPADSSIHTVADIDQRGRTVGVIRNNPTDRFLTGALKLASLKRANTEAELIDMMRRGEADVMALARWNAAGRLEQLPGFRVLNDNFAEQPVAFAIPKERPEAMRCINAFIASAKANGLIDAIARSGYAGLQVAQ